MFASDVGDHRHNAFPKNGLYRSSDGRPALQDHDIIVDGKELRALLLRAYKITAIRRVASRPLFSVVIACGTQSRSLTPESVVLNGGDRFRSLAALRHQEGAELP